MAEATVAVGGSSVNSYAAPGALTASGHAPGGATWVTVTVASSESAPGSRITPEPSGSSTLAPSAALTLALTVGSGPVSESWVSLPVQATTRATATTR